MFRALICSSTRGTVYATISIFCTYYVGWLIAGLEWNQFHSNPVGPVILIYYDARFSTAAVVIGKRLSVVNTFIAFLCTKLKERQFHITTARLYALHFSAPSFVDTSRVLS
jgi:hypothetical protein